MKKALVLILSAALMLIQSGCYDSREIDETAYIIAIGIDSEDSGYKYTFQFAAPLAISGEGGGGGEEGEDAGNPGVCNRTVTAADFYVARNMLNNFLSKNIDMSHLKMIVFSGTVGGDDLVRHSRLFRREREVRPHTVVAVAKDSAGEFLRSVNPELEANTAKYYELMSLRSNNIYAPSMRLHEFSDELSAFGCSALPIAWVSDAEKSTEPDSAAIPTKAEGWVRSDKDRVLPSKSVLRGMAVFRDGEIVGEMDGDNALIYNILRRDVKRFTVSMENRHKSGYTLTFDVTLPSAAHYRVEESGGRYHITVNQEMEPRYIGDGLPEGYGSQSELMQDFYDAAENEIRDFMYATAKELGADIMQTGSCLKRKCLTADRWKSLDWQEKYRDAEFDVVIE